MIKDKVAVLGPNNGAVKLFVPDGFTTQQTIDEAPEAAPGMFLSVAGVPIDKFEGKGAEFAKAFKPRLGGKEIDPYAIYGAQAAELMLNAIGESDGTRADVIAKMFAAEDQRRLPRDVLDQRERRSGRRRGRGRGLHDLQGHGQARDRDDDLSEAGGRRGGARLDEARTTDPGKGYALPRVSFRFSPQWRR